MSAQACHGTIQCLVCEQQLSMAKILQQENWYSPQPGIPYQPLLAMPQQFVNLWPIIDECGIAFFTGYDPPKTLAPAIAMAPVITTNTPQIAPPAPAPSPTQDPGPRETLISDNTALGPVSPPAPTRTSLLTWLPGRGSQTDPSGETVPNPDARSNGEDNRQHMDPRTQLQACTSITSERDGAQEADALVNSVKDAGQGAISDQSDEPAQSAVTVVNDDNPVSVLGTDFHLQANSRINHSQIAGEADITINRTRLETGDTGTFIETSGGSTVRRAEYESSTVASRASSDPKIAPTHSSRRHATTLIGSRDCPIISSALGTWNNSGTRNVTCARTVVNIFTGLATPRNGSGRVRIF